jgi:hypothetical protein
MDTYVMALSAVAVMALAAIGSARLVSSRARRRRQAALDAYADREIAQERRLGSRGPPHKTLLHFAGLGRASPRGGFFAAAG